MWKNALMCLWVSLSVTAAPVWAEEPDHAIHEELAHC